MNARSCCYKEMPDGVSKRDEAVALEEDYAHHVEDASQRQFTHTSTLHLEHFLKKKWLMNIQLKENMYIFVTKHIKQKEFQDALQ